VILVYLVPLAINEGISIVAAASLITVMSAVSVVTRLFTPIMSERLGTKPVMAFWYFMQGVPVVMLFFTHDLWMFYVFAVVFGIGYGGESGGFPILNRSYFGHAPVGSVHGTQMLGAGLGMALGGWIGGPLFDLYGSYDIALWVSIIASLAGAVSILFLEPTKRLLIPDWDAVPAPDDGPKPQPDAPLREAHAPAGDS
jgi:MFS family permease